MSFVPLGLVTNSPQQFMLYMQVSNDYEAERAIKRYGIKRICKASRVDTLMTQAEDSNCPGSKLRGTSGTKTSAP